MSEPRWILGLVNDSPSSGPAPAFTKRRNQPAANDRTGLGMRRGWPRPGVQFAVHDLGDQRVGEGGQVLVRGRAIEGWNPRHRLHHTSSSRTRRARARSAGPAVFRPDSADSERRPERRGKNGHVPGGARCSSCRGRKDGRGWRERRAPGVALAPAQPETENGELKAANRTVGTHGPAVPSAPTSNTPVPNSGRPASAVRQP